MTLQEALVKCKKLFALATSSNPHEASLAAAKAAEIMFEYQISEAALGSISLDEPVEVHPFEEPSDRRKISHWRGYIASACAYASSCRMFWSNAEIRLIGRKSDVQTAKYLFDMIVPQVENLCNQTWERLTGVTDRSVIDLSLFDEGSKEDEDYFPVSPVNLGDRRRWSHAFRLGCARTIGQRIISQHRDRLNQMPRSDSTQALMVIKDRMAKVNQFASKFEWVEGRGPSMNSLDGYVQGKQAGQKVHIGTNAKGSLLPARDQLGS